MRSRADCLVLDAGDPLAALRGRFELPEDVVYLDGNSLGALPKTTAPRIEEVVRSEWGEGLIRSWNSAGWIDLAERVGDRIGVLVGAPPGELVVTDSTSVNLYKALSVALSITRADAPQRRVILSERGNFPTDLYIADSVARERGFELKLVDRVAAEAPCDDTVALVMLTHVDYRSGRMHRMAETTRAVHDAGALMLWDLAHSVGAVPVDLHGAAEREAADFAVGCGYKYLNGGPGAPAFVWAHPRQTERMDRERWRQPLSGWLGHAAPFEFRPDYEPAAGIRRFVCGTPPILALAALDCGVAVFDAAEPLGGIAALRTKSVALAELFIEQVEARCADHGLALATPRAAAERGSHASFAHPEGGYPIMQALIARGVIGDFRAPDLLRFGFTPLYTRYVDAFDAAAHLATVLDSGEWREARFGARATVT